VSDLTRAFVAVEVSEGARREIADLLGRLQRQPGDVVRWGRPELMHLTLVFLGEVSQGFLESAKLRLAEVARQQKAFNMQLKGLGAFPSPARARVVWIGTEQGKDEVCALQADIVKALRSVGHQPESRPFSPHLTIGRLSMPGDAGRAVAVGFESVTFTIGRVVLFRSVLQPTGPVYSALAEFPLSGQPA
jgi:RNA 2',3'-cyclic 3'-phosphodiesterase